MYMALQSDPTSVPNIQQDFVPKKSTVQYKTEYVQSRLWPLELESFTAFSGFLKEEKVGAWYMLIKKLFQE